MKVVANSLPKSGTHVLTRVLDVLGLQEARAHFSASLIRPNMYDPVNSIRKLGRYCMVDRERNGISVDLDCVCRNLKKDWFVREVGLIQQNSYVQGHLPYSPDIVEIFMRQDFRVLHIIRDPRDVLLSYVNHICRDRGYQYHRKLNSLNTMEEKLLAVMGGLWEPFQPLDFSNRFRNTLGWQADPRVCLVRFEDVIGSKGGGRVDAQAHSIRSILNHLGFDSNDEAGVNKICSRVFDENSHTFHKGRIGSWQESFTPKALELFNEKFGRETEGLGYKLQ